MSRCQFYETCFERKLFHLENEMCFHPQPDADGVCLFAAVKDNKLLIKGGGDQPQSSPKDPYLYDDSTGEDNDVAEGRGGER